MDASELRDSLHRKRRGMEGEAEGYAIRSRRHILLKIFNASKTFNILNNNNPLMTND